MSKFVELTDYDASIHRDILDALVREDETVIEVCEDRAIAEMRCYLSNRYEWAVEWMKAVADEDISIEGAPLLPEEQRAGRSDFRIQSNRKRTNHW